MIFADRVNWRIFEEVVKTIFKCFEWKFDLAGILSSIYKENVTIFRNSFWFSESTSTFTY